MWHACGIHMIYIPIKTTEKLMISWILQSMARPLGPRPHLGTHAVEKMLLWTVRIVCTAFQNESSLIIDRPSVNDLFDQNKSQQHLTAHITHQVHKTEFGPPQAAARGILHGQQRIAACGENDKPADS